MNQQIWNFIKYNGGFDQKYKGKEPDFCCRFPTFKAALSLFLQRGLKNIVETGCQRAKEDWSAGCSSLVFAETLQEFPEKGLLYSIDINSNNLQTCYECIKHIDNSKFRFVHADSIHALSVFNEEIGLLYLDSYDIAPPNEDPEHKLCQEHQLKEIQAVFNKLNDNSVILLDDAAPFDLEGKTLLSKQFLRENGWVCALEQYQSLFIKT